MLPLLSPTRLALGSLVLGVVVLALKFLAYALTGSVALYADALESTVNVATALAALIAVRYAALPPDHNHHYGHHKAEYFSAVLAGTLIIVAAVFIVQQAWHALSSPHQLAAPLPGLLINGLATVLNAAWCALLWHQGLQHRSPALVADAQHLLTDVASSIGVTLGILLALATGYSVLDPLLALLVAANILWAGWQVMQSSLGGLMDAAVPPATLARIQHTINYHLGQALEYHDLRTRQAGAMVFIEFHLVVHSHLTVAASHALCDDLETALKQAVGPTTTRVTIHVEPESKAKHTKP